MSTTASPPPTLQDLRRALRAARYEDALRLAEGCTRPDKRRRWLGEILREAIQYRRHAQAHEALDRGATPDGFLQGLSLLAHAIRYEQNDIAERLLDEGAQVNAQKPDSGYHPRNWTALMWAAQHANHALMCRLLERGADLRAQSALGTTAVLCALTSAKPVDTLQMFLEHGLDPQDVLSDSAPPLVRSNLRKQPHTLELLRSWQRREGLAPRRANTSAPAGAPPEADPPHL